jgi:hypothetical protein
MPDFRFCFHKPAVGQLALPAISHRSEFFSIAAIDFPARSKAVIDPWMLRFQLGRPQCSGCGQ